MRGDHALGVVVFLVFKGPPPHARGPHPRRSGRRGCGGPPPHARGPPRHPVAASRLGGTTPACAGTTSCCRCPSGPHRDHPRMRGDHSRVLRASHRKPGPPPHARGPPGSRARRHQALGTTPACAGTTTNALPTTTMPWDHPRMRGDHDCGDPADDSARGPPPHARGPQIEAVMTSRNERDHPRMRGDHAAPGIARSIIRGPPPHARGPPDTDGVGGEVSGTTPACAGTTSGPCSKSGPDGDHPRMRGDHGAQGAAGGAHRGPPPHARGPQWVGLFRGDLIGTTPACAGTTCARATTFTTRWDHPRMRGDHSRLGVTPERAVGPPPHARGPRAPGTAPSSGQGTTPACAGTTDGRRPATW